MAGPLLIVREDGQRSGSVMGLKHHPVWMRLGQGRNGGMGTFGKAMTALRCRITEIQATG